MKRIVTFVLMIGLVCCIAGCSDFWSAGEGRGDWDVSVCTGYEIAKINSKGVKLNRTFYNGSSSYCVIEKYFITAFQVREPYVCLRGIITKDRWISDEELDANREVYYLLKTDPEELAGPFVTFNALAEYCATCSVTVRNRWIDIDSKSAKPPEIRDTGMVVSSPREECPTGSEG